MDPGSCFTKSAQGQQMPALGRRRVRRDSNSSPLPKQQPLTELLHASLHMTTHQLLQAWYAGGRQGCLERPGRTVSPIHRCLTTSVQSLRDLCDHPLRLPDTPKPQPCPSHPVVGVISFFLSEFLVFNNLTAFPEVWVFICSVSAPVL